MFSVGDRARDAYGRVGTVVKVEVHREPDLYVDQRSAPVLAGYDEVWVKVEFDDARGMIVSFQPQDLTAA
ncbi:hypothetical protein [Patulibacter defluvii]|uniref:hypothetical protein n=1 Tax=Patulibacter defluvii TaxID=3095358 RepID=UPI002A75EDD4|nr:hypothetical protein [Patulibacter sp. DM4]